MSGDAEARKVISLPERSEPSLKYLGGSDFDQVNNAFMSQLANALPLSVYPGEAERDDLIRTATLTVAGIAPNDQIEGMIAVQMAASHYVAMDCVRRAMIANQSVEARNLNLGYANKFIRSCAALVEALDRHRGKGQQTIKVEHVHVHEGGQAIVGNVSHPGGGSPGRIGKQPDGPKGLAASNGAAVPCAIKALEELVPQSRG